MHWPLFHFYCCPGLYFILSGIQIIYAPINSETISLSNQMIVLESELLDTTLPGSDSHCGRLRTTVALSGLKDGSNTIFYRHDCCSIKRYEVALSARTRVKAKLYQY